MSLSSSLTMLFLGFAKRHPFIAGTPLVLLGLWLMWLSARLGAEVDQFMGVEPVFAEVITADDNPQRDPRYAANVIWKTDCPPAASPPAVKRGRKRREVAEPCVVAHRALVEIPDRLLPSEKALDPENRLRPGSKVKIVVSKTAPEVAISAESLSDIGIVTLGGRNLDGKALVFGGLVLLVGIAILVKRERIGD